jgi:hypothetical protein
MTATRFNCQPNQQAQKKSKQTKRTVGRDFAFVLASQVTKKMVAGWLGSKRPGCW